MFHFIVIKLNCVTHHPPPTVQQASVANLGSLGYLACLVAASALAIYWWNTVSLTTHPCVPWVCPNSGTATVCCTSRARKRPITRIWVSSDKLLNEVYKIVMGLALQQCFSKWGVGPLVGNGDMTGKARQTVDFQGSSYWFIIKYVVTWFSFNTFGGNWPESLRTAIYQDIYWINPWNLWWIRLKNLFVVLATN